MPSFVAARVALPISSARIKRTANLAVRSIGRNTRSTGVSIAFVGDAEMRRLNERYHHARGTTDVLAFPGTGNEFGEIVISLPQAKRQARRYGHALTREVDILLVHGLLHLAGYRHDSRAARLRMVRTERRILAGQSLIHRSTSMI